LTPWLTDLGNRDTHTLSTNGKIPDGMMINQNKMASQRLVTKIDNKTKIRMSIALNLRSTGALICIIHKYVFIVLNIINNINIMPPSTIIAEIPTGRTLPLPSLEPG
jgi:hypothetical protein